MTFGSPRAPVIADDPSCSLCGGRTRSVHLAGIAFRRCDECVFSFRPDMTTDADSRSVYETGSYAESTLALQYTDDAQLAAHSTSARRRLEWLRDIRSTGRLLDVGAGSGGFVREATAWGYDAEGVEPSPEFAHYARTVVGARVHSGRLQDLDLAPRSVDIVTAWHVLEHVPQAHLLIQAMGDILVEDGVLVVEVPNAESAMARRLGDGWSGLQPEVHVNQFSPTSLRATLTAGGLSVVEIHTVGHGAYMTPVQRATTPSYLAHRLQLRRAGVRGLRQPEGHEYIRAVAMRTADPRSAALIGRG